jgi:hypothetical protein
MCQIAKHAKVVSKTKGGIFKVVKMGKVEMYAGTLSNGILSQNASNSEGIFLVQCSVAELVAEKETTSTNSLKCITSVD